MNELRSNIEWKQWGKEDPLWAVSSWTNKQKGGDSPWTDEEFYTLGASDWSDFWRHWQQYGVGTESCLEIGCGAGRITKQLAKTFDCVYAVDVSDQMIHRAQKAIGQTNIEFQTIDGINLPQKDGSVGAIFSTHVLQHLDNSDTGLSYFREFFRVLDIGGTIMIHLPLYQFPHENSMMGFPMRAFYGAFRQLSSVRSNMKRRMGKKTMRDTPYPIKDLYLFLSRLGFKSIEYRIFPVKSNGDPHPFVFATK